jgi:uncharacterized membrane protein
VKIADERITKYGLALLAIVLIGLFLRVYQLGTQSIWLDESVSISISGLSVPQLVQAAAPDVHPPLYYFLLHYWMMVFGTSASAVRLLSVLFGVLAIPMIYVVGRQLFNKGVGLVGALILALSSFNIYYSQEARMYSLLVLLALVSMYFFWRFLQQSNLVSSVGYVLSTTLLVYTHYFGWFVLIAQNIYVVTLLLLSKNRTYKLRHWVAVQAIVLALYVPWMGIAVNQASQRLTVGESVGQLLQPTIVTIIQTFGIYSDSSVLLSALFLALSALSLFAYKRVRGSMDWKAPLKAFESYSWEVHIQDATPVYFLVVLLLSINVIPSVISYFYTPVYYYRYTIAASVALYLLVGKGIANINYRLFKVVVISVIIILSALQLPWNYYAITKPQAREATSFIDANAKSGDAVLIYPGWESQTFNYYNNRTDVAVKQIYYGNGSVDIQSDVNGRDRVWFYGATGYGTPIENFTLNFLNESYAKIYVNSYYGYSVYLYEKRA